MHKKVYIYIYSLLNMTQVGEIHAYAYVSESYIMIQQIQKVTKFFFDKGMAIFSNEFKGSRV